MWRIANGSRRPHRADRRPYYSPAMSEEGRTQFHYHLELTPPQLKITHTALRSLLDDFGHEQQDVIAIIHEVLAKLPDEHAIRAIQLESTEGTSILEVVGEPEGLEAVGEPEGSDDDPSPAAA
jgi:hypothetical protein